MSLIHGILQNEDGVLTWLLCRGRRSKLAPKIPAGKGEDGMGARSVFSEMFTDATDRNLLSDTKYCT